MPARLRLTAALAACLLGTAALSLALWQRERSDVRADARRDVRAAAAAIGARADAAVLALQGIRAALDAGPSPDAAPGRAAFATQARVPLDRPEIVSVGWAPRVAAAARGELEATHRIRIAPTAGALFLYPLLRSEPPAAGRDVLDLGSDPALGATLRLARTTGAASVSAPVRLPGDGRLGVYAFAPVYRRGLPLGTPGERREALRGLVVGAIAADELVAAALDGLPEGLDVRVGDGPTALSGRLVSNAAVAHAAVGDRSWRVAVAVRPASPLLPLGAAGAGLALALLLLVGHRRLERGGEDVRALRRALDTVRSRAGRDLSAAKEKQQESERTVELVAAAGEAIVLDVDRDGRIRSCSGAVERLLGYAPAELAGTEIFALLHPDELLGPPSGPRRYAAKGGEYVVLETSRLTRRDELGFAAGVVTVLREPVRQPAARTAAQRIADAVALEPDPVELFSIVAEEAALELAVPAAAVVRFEAGGFGTVTGAWERGGGASIVPGTTIELEPPAPAALVFRHGTAVPGAAPIRVGARLWGAIVAEGAAPEALAALAEAAQAAVALADAGARLTALATRDGLTNLPDHRSFQEQLRAEVRRAQRHERPLSLALVNLDGFRRVNDEHGRLAGDRVLAEAGRRLAATVRQGEVVSRIGGDHFAWILPETEGLNGWIAAERARRAISALPFEGVGPVTASAGVCDLEDVGGADELLALTEVALVHAKSSGGDATFRYSRELDDDGEADGEREAPGDLQPLARLRTLAQELDAEDPGTEGHSERVARLAEKLALSAGWSGERAVRLAQAAFVHDVGKLSVSDEVLRKAGPLDEAELEAMRNHPDTGAELAVNALDPEQLSWVRHHHERWDGAGYPSGLAGDLIPAGALLLGLAEAWDAMTSSRLYGAALSVTEALAECRRESGRQFAPDAVAALERLWTLGALAEADVRAAIRDA